MHAVASHQDDVAYLSILNTLVQFFQVAGMTRHETDSNFKVLGRGFLGQLDHAARRRSIRRTRLFHEHIQSFLDRISKVHPTESQGCRKDGDVSRLEAVPRLFLAIKGNEFKSVR